MNIWIEFYLVKQTYLKTFDCILKDDEKTNLSSTYSSLNIKFAAMLKGQYFENKPQ